jgi:TPR repeat protein
MHADSPGGRPARGPALAGALLVLLLTFGQAHSVRAATYDEGLAAFEAGRFREAAELWLALADEGNPQAQYAIGKLYESGQGVPQNYARAAEWYGRAAEQGLAAAQNNLALLHNNGRGVPRDPIRAVQLWQDAARLGHTQAQYNLGLAYYLGEGIALDDEEAARWFLAAAQAGLPEAQFAVGQMHRMGVGLPKDEAAALGWYQQAASQGHAEAARKAGELQAAGIAPQAPSLSGQAVAAVTPAPAPAPAAPAAGGPEVPLAAAAEPAAAAPEPTVVPPPQIVGRAPAEDVEEEDVPAAIEEGDDTADAGEQVAEAAPPPAPPAPQPALSITGLDGAPLVLPPPEKPSQPVQLASAEVADAPAEAAPVATPAPAPAPVTAAPATLPQPAQLAMLTPDAKGSGLVWLGTGGSEADAKALAALVAARFPEVFAGLPPKVAKREEGGKARWRVEAGPVADAEAARALCAALRAVEPNLFCKGLTKG